MRGRSPIRIQATPRCRRSPDSISLEFRRVARDRIRVRDEVKSIGSILFCRRRGRSEQSRLPVVIDESTACSSSLAVNKLYLLYEVEIQRCSAVFLHSDIETKCYQRPVFLFPEKT